MSVEAIHGAKEVALFVQFAPLSGLRVAAGTIEKRDPPEPDIRCIIEGEGAVAFELAELCAEDLAVLIAHAPTEGAAFQRTSDPSASILRKKLKKQYETSCPIELLLYTNGRAVTPDDGILATLLPILESRDGPYRRVWLLSEKGAYEVWRAG